MCIEVREVYITDANRNRITVASAGSTIYVWFKFTNTCFAPIFSESFKLFKDNLVISERVIYGSWFTGAWGEDFFVYEIPRTYSGQLKLGVASKEDYDEGIPPKYSTINVIYIQPGKGSINIDSSPIGATVYLNGRKVGVTPITVENIDPGTYEIRLVKSGYKEVITRVTVVAGELTNVFVMLEKQKFELPQWLLPFGSGVAGLVIGIITTYIRKKGRKITEVEYEGVK